MANTPNFTHLPILTLNGGSSSIKFAIFHDEKLFLSGQVERIGQTQTSLTAKSVSGEMFVDRPVKASDHDEAAFAIIALLSESKQRDFAGIGHRIVHGGLKLHGHQIVNDEVIAELKRTVPLDVAHLPREIALIEAFAKHYPKVPQVICLDSAFHRDLPRVAKLLPIPRLYDEAGIHRFGFHGLSYTFLIDALRKTAGDSAANGKVILAHLGSGASMAALVNGKPVDTSMSFTPTAGLVMGTRCGDLDPGLVLYLMRSEKFSADGLDQFLNSKCGLLGISQTSSDMRDLIEKRSTDIRAAEAIELFCYSARKYIGAYSAAMGGLDTIVFSGGIGEHSVEAREEICQGLEFLGVQIDNDLNRSAKPIISSAKSRVMVRIIKTDEELVIAQTVQRLIASQKDSIL